MKRSSPITSKILLLQDIQARQVSLGQAALPFPSGSPGWFSLISSKIAWRTALPVYSRHQCPALDVGFSEVLSKVKRFYDDLQILHILPGDNAAGNNFDDEILAKFGNYSLDQACKLSIVIDRHFCLWICQNVVHNTKII